MIDSPTGSIESLRSSEHKLLKDFIMITMGALALMVIAFMNSGLFTYLLPYVPAVVRYGVYAAWLGLALISSRQFVNKLVIQMWPLLLFYFYMIFISLFIETSLEVYIKNITYLIMVYSIFLYYFNNKFQRFQKVFCAFLVIDFIAVGINTYIQLQINPLIVRYLATTPEIIEAMLGEGAFPGIGSYGYFYALVALILLMGFRLFNNKDHKLVLLFGIMAAFVLLIQASYTIAIIFTCIFLALIVILRYTNKHTVIAIVLLGIISLLTFQGAVASMFGQLANVEKLPYEVSVRLNEISYYLSGHDVSGTDLNSRKNLYYQSIEAFAHNIFGGTALSGSYMYRAGGHSAWLDLLANFGLFSIPFFIFLYKAYKYCKNRIPLNLRQFINVYWLYFICLGFINTALFAPIYMMWFLFLPLFINAFLDERKLPVAH